MDGTLVQKVAREVVAQLERNAQVSCGSGQEPQVSTPGKIFLTAQMLIEKLAKTDGGTLVLAANEYLTPAAVDLAARRQLAVARSAEATRGPDLRHPAPPRVAPVLSGRPSWAGGPVGLIVHRLDDKVQSVLRALEYDGVKFTDRTAGDCWMVNLRALCRSVVDGGLSAGVAMLPYAADAMVLANKIRGVRAVQGTRLASVAAGVRRFGANVLILEHALSTFHELRAMARAFVTDRMVSGTAGDVQAAIADQEGT